MVTEDTTAQKKEIKLSWKVSGSKISLTGLAGALINKVIAILAILKMDSEMILANSIHLTVTFMMVLGAWMRSKDMELSLKKIQLKLILDSGKMEEFSRKKKKNLKKAPRILNYKCL